MKPRAVGAGTELVAQVVDTDDVVAVANGDRTGRVAVLVGLHQRFGEVAPLESRTLPRSGERARTQQQQSTYPSEEPRG